MKRRRRRFRPWDPLLPCITFLGCSVPSMPPGESNYCPRCLKLNFDVLQCANLPPAADSTPERGSRGDALCRDCFGEVGKASQLSHA